MPPTLLPDPAQLRLICLSATDARITLDVCPRSLTARCPLCGQPSERVHSRYCRTLADLPWSGLAVRLRLHARRFFCGNQVCQRRIFTERLPGVVDPYARRTTRLTGWFSQVAFALGGEPGARLLCLAATPISGDTLLGCLRSFPIPAPGTPTVLSVDDFALRRGRTYGTILVDLERHRVVDLLPDRSADTLADWLAQHPGVTIISRDRGGEYAEGAKRGAPDAMQVADRFHLLRNAGDVTRRVLQRHAPLVQTLPAPGPSEFGLTRRRLDRAAAKQQTRDTMRARFERIHALAGEGLSKEAIARRLGLNRKTVYTYLALDAPPERRHTWRRGSAITPYEGYMLRRWQQGCRNGRELWRELQDQGYTGAYHNVARIMAYLRQQEHKRDRSPPAPSGLTVRRAVGILVTRSADRSDDEQRTVEQLTALHPEVGRAVTLLAEFAGLVRASPLQTASGDLNRWMAEAESSDLPEFLTFVTKLHQDRDAVVAGLTLPWSQGRIEGQVTRVKLIKRSMYGRAKFDLLRQRILYSSTAA